MTGPASVNADCLLSTSHKNWTRNRGFVGNALSGQAV